MNFTFSQEKIVLQGDSYFSLKSIQGFLSNLCLGVKSYVI